MLIISYIALCLLFIVYLYTLSVRIEGKIINVMVPYLIITVPTLYVFEGIFVYLSEVQKLYSGIFVFLYLLYNIHSIICYFLSLHTKKTHIQQIKHEK
ncbi:O-antigen polymerase [Salmonella sp. NCTC 11881]|nr:O-antigen polymerase [Salmonella sp. NCTC 11881]